MLSELCVGEAAAPAAVQAAADGLPLRRPVTLQHGQPPVLGEFNPRGRWTSRLLGRLGGVRSTRVERKEVPAAEQAAANGRAAAAEARGSAEQPGVAASGVW